jgi:hypothetical protein
LTSQSKVNPCINFEIYRLGFIVGDFFHKLHNLVTLK